MSVAEVDPAASKPAKRGAFDRIGVGVSLRLVLAPMLCIAVLTCGLWALTYLALLCSRNGPGAAAGSDADIIGEQVRRAAESPPADLAFIGDSSCLFGIDPATLRERFPGKSIENFCTSAWVGPAGYGVQITHMIEKGTLPHKLVLYFNPIQFNRTANWDAWVDMVKGRVQGAQSTTDLSLMASLDYARRNWLARALYQPVSAYSLYYGSFDNLLEGMRSGHGVLVNPSDLADMAFPGEDARACREWPVPLKVLPYEFAVTAEYERALTDLARILNNLDRSRIYLMIAPAAVPLWPEALSSRDRVADLIADKLGLGSGNIIRSPVSLPAFCFTDGVHPSRRGRILLTRALADHLPPF